MNYMYEVQKAVDEVLVGKRKCYTRMLPRQCGKTTLCIDAATRYATSNPGSRVALVVSNGDRATQLLQQIDTGTHADHYVTLYNGSRIIVKSAESFIATYPGTEYSLIIIDDVTRDTHESAYYQLFDALSIRHVGAFIELYSDMRHPYVVSTMLLNTHGYQVLNYGYIRKIGHGELAGRLDPLGKLAECNDLELADLFGVFH